jgi:hypothetical protein
MLVNLGRRAAKRYTSRNMVDVPFLRAVKLAKGEYSVRLPVRQFT